MRAWQTGTVVAGADERACEPPEGSQADGERLPLAEGPMRATILAQIQALAVVEAFRITLHAHGAMRDEASTLDEVLEVMATGQILADYPDHRRGHVVCSADRPGVGGLYMWSVRRPSPCS